MQLPFSLQTTTFQAAQFFLLVPTPTLALHVAVRCSCVHLCKLSFLDTLHSLFPSYLLRGDAMRSAGPPFAYGEGSVRDGSTHYLVRWQLVTDWSGWSHTG